MRMLALLACFHSLLSATVIGAKSAVTWDSVLPAGTKLSVCEGQPVKFPWKVKVAEGHEITGNEWRRQIIAEDGSEKTEHSHELAKGLKAFSLDNRFHYGPDLQLQINRAIVDDTGNYTVTAYVTSPKGNETYNNTVSLVVKSSPKVAGETITIQLDTRAVKVASGPKAGWHLRLICGRFESLGNPPVSIIWESPTRTSLSSTSYEGGKFYLDIPEGEVEYGHYTCRVHSEEVLQCARENRFLMEPSVDVSAFNTQVILLEAKLKEELKATQDKLQKTEETLQTALRQLEKAGRDMENRTSQLEKSMLRFSYRNCLEAKTMNPQSGITTLYVGRRTFQVYCEQETDGGGWAVIQRRSSGALSFNRTWNEYEQGFGDLDGDHWLGLEKMYALTSSGMHNLRVDIKDPKNTSYYARYGSFYLDDSSKDYRMHLSHYWGDAGDSMNYKGFEHNNMPFITPDMDNRCARMYHNGWWFNDCQYGNLNGPYSPGLRSYGMTWGTVSWQLRYSRMMVR